MWIIYEVKTFIMTDRFKVLKLSKFHTYIFGFVSIIVPDFKKNTQI